MFHTHVLAGSGNVVDFDRASFLMDRDLLDAATSAMRDEQQNRPRRDANYGAQWVWDFYCNRHFERHGEPFAPDVNPTWDRPAPAGPAPLPPRRPEQR